MMKWEKKAVDPEQVKTLTKNYPFNALEASLLLRRGVETPEALKFFLEEDLRYLHNPGFFKEMPRALDRLLTAVEEKEKVLIYGDKDVDGVTATVFLLETLREFGLSPEWRVPVGSSSYGLSLADIDDCIEKEITLLITVDCGIGDFEEIRKAGEQGIDVLIFDHHKLREGEAPEARAVVNPQEKDSPYPFLFLSGCSVVSKVVWMLCLAQTEIYNRSLCLLHAPKNRKGKTELHIVKLLNLREQERLIVREESSLEEVSRFLEGQSLFVFRKKEIEPVLKRFFGQAEIYSMDWAPEAEKLFPKIRSVSVERLLLKSRLPQYRREPTEEIDILSSLFVTFILKKAEDRFRPFRKGLDLVAVSLLADIMPLADENRIFLRQGLAVLKKGERLPLRRLMEEQEITAHSLNAKEISWKLNPVLNAPGRMGQADLAVEFLLSRNEAECEVRLKKILELNQCRRKETVRLQKKLSAKIRESFQKMEEKLILLKNSSIPKGITGLLAAYWSRIFRVPAIIMAEEDGILTGSIRTEEKGVVGEIFAASSSYLLQYGGHEMAAGFSLEKDQLPNFEKTLSALIRNPDGRLGKSEKEKKKNDSSVWAVDAELPLSWLRPELCQTIRRFEPYGHGFKPFLFLVRELLVEEASLFGKKSDHLKLQVYTGHYRWPAVLWNGAREYGNLFKTGDRVDLLFHLYPDSFAGRFGDGFRLDIKAVEKSSPQ